MSNETACVHVSDLFVKGVRSSFTGSTVAMKIEQILCLYLHQPLLECFHIVFRKALKCLTEKAVFRTFANLMNVWLRYKSS